MGAKRWERGRPARIEREARKFCFPNEARTLCRGTVRTPGYSEPMILRYSSSLNAFSDSVLTLPCDAKPRIALA
jgi:hypothetical protein